MSLVNSGSNDGAIQTTEAAGAGSAVEPPWQAQTQAKAEAEGSAAKEPSPAKETSTVLQDRSKQIVWIELSKDAVRGRLKDPRSAQFRNVIFHAYQEKTPVVCGEVNAKNAFGGYSGYVGFVASGKTLVVLESDFVDGGEFAKTWNEVCLR